MTNKSIYTVEQIVAYMESVSPSSKFAKVSYDVIAKRYIDFNVFESLKAIHNHGDSESRSIEFSISNINAQLPNKFANKRWLPLLKAEFPFYNVVSTGYRTATVTMLSRVILLFSQTQLTQYWLTTDTNSVLNAVSPIGTDYIVTPIDTDNLKKYIANQLILSDKPGYNTNALLKNAVQGANIMSRARAYGGLLPQSYDVKSTGRCYLKGINLHNCRSSVREAALGKCHKIDMSSSMYAYMLTIIQQHYSLSDVDVKKFTMNDLILNKAEIRNRMVQECLTDTRADDQAKTQFIKAAIQAIGFGANPKNTRGAVADAIWNIADRTRFSEHWWVTQLLEEIDLYREIMRIHYADESKHLGDSIKKNGRSNFNKYCSYHYQCAESEAMRKVLKELDPNNILLVVHDAVYTRSAPDILLCNHLAQTVIPNAVFEHTQIDPVKYNIAAIEQAIELETEHKQRMKHEQAKAQA